MITLRENISTRDLMAFVALVRTGSFTGAAELLHITQSALSKRVAELEQKLAVRLFDRTTRRLDLTAEGRAFVTSAEALLQQFEQSIGQLRSLAQGTSGELKLCSASNMASQVVAPVLAGFLRSNPRVNFSLYDCQTRKQMLEHIANGTADVGLIGGLPDQDHGISSEFTLTEVTVVRERMVVCFAHGHPLEAFEKVDWNDIKPWPRIGLRSKYGLGHVTGSLERVGQLGNDYTLGVTMINTAVALAGAGCGVAIFPFYVVGGGRPNIGWREIRGADHDYVFSYVHLRGKGLSGASRVFGQHVSSFLHESHNQA